MFVVRSETHRFLTKLSGTEQRQPEACQVRRTVGKACTPRTGNYPAGMTYFFVPL